MATAVNNVQVTGQGNDLKLDLNSLYQTSAPGRVPDRARDLRDRLLELRRRPDRRRRSGRFLQTALSPGAQQALPDAGYVPLPEQFKQRLTTAVNAIQ